MYVWCIKADRLWLKGTNFSSSAIFANAQNRPERVSFCTSVPYTGAAVVRGLRRPSQTRLGPSRTTGRHIMFSTCLSVCACGGVLRPACGRLLASTVL